MFKFVGKIIGVILTGIGVYVVFQFMQGEESVTVNVPEVTFEEVVDASERVIDVVNDIDVDEVVDAVEDVLDEELRGDSENPEGENATTEDTENEGIIEIPEQFNLAIPFTSQAPHANWALPYQEACEEASAYMVSAYYAGMESGLIDPDIADAELLELVAFEQDFLGTYLDTTALETVNFIDAFYQYGSFVKLDPTVEEIKAEIAAGRPVIVPAAGKLLGNPFFSGDGPLYHMLVIKGYTENAFIVNDPGTRNGENFVYDIDVIMNAMGDWNGGDPEHGAKVVIFTQQ